MHKRTTLVFLTTAILVVVALSGFCCAYSVYDSQVSDWQENPCYKYYYNQLDVNQQFVYDWLSALSPQNGEFTITIPDPDIVYEHPGSVIIVASAAFKEDLPEQSAWLDCTFLVDEPDTDQGTFHIAVRQMSAFSDEINQKTREILDLALANADTSWDRYTKACYVTQAVTALLEYDPGEDADYYILDRNQSLICVVSGRGVCTGFSKLYKALADRIGLP